MRTLWSFLVSFFVCGENKLGKNRSFCLKVATDVSGVEGESSRNRSERAAADDATKGALDEARHAGCVTQRARGACAAEEREAPERSRRFLLGSPFFPASFARILHHLSRRFRSVPPFRCFLHLTAHLVQSGFSRVERSKCTLWSFLVSFFVCGQNKLGKNRSFCLKVAADVSGVEGESSRNRSERAFFSESETPSLDWVEVLR